MLPTRLLHALLPLLTHVTGDPRVAEQFRRARGAALLTSLTAASRFRGAATSVQALIAQHFKKAALVQRDDIRRLNNVLEAQLKTKGMVFNNPDIKPFREVLSKAGFYQEWKTKYGPEAIGKLEKYTGQLA